MPLLGLIEVLEHEIRRIHLLRLFRADADADAAVIFTDVLRDRFDTVVACRTATYAASDLAEVDIEFVVHHYGLLVGELIKMLYGLERFPAQVHKSLGFAEDDTGVTDGSLGKLALQVLFGHPGVEAVFAGKVVYADKADVVAVFCIFLTRVTQANDQQRLIKAEGGVAERVANLRPSLE